MRLTRSGCICLVMCVLVNIMLIFMALRWWVLWGPSDMQGDDDYYLGKTRQTPPPAGQPRQVFPLYNRFTLEVYDPATNEPAPTVLLRDQDGRMKWCIYACYACLACPDEREALVKDVSFTAWRRWPFKELRVRGRALWRFGDQRTLWYLTEDGDLKGYWFCSW
jgi:hypothetical protein